MGRNHNYQWKLPSTGRRTQFWLHASPRGWSEFTLPASRESVPVEAWDQDFSQGWCWHELHLKESLDKAYNLPLLHQRGKVNFRGLTWCSCWLVPAGPFFPSKAGCRCILLVQHLWCFSLIHWIFISVLILSRMLYQRQHGVCRLLLSPLHFCFLRCYNNKIQST